LINDSDLWAARDNILVKMASLLRGLDIPEGHLCMLYTAIDDEFDKLQQLAKSCSIPDANPML
jgi:hypothetical protein